MFFLVLGFQERMGFGSTFFSVFWSAYPFSRDNSLVSSERNMVVDFHIHKFFSGKYNDIDLASYSATNYRKAESEMVIMQTCCIEKRF
jgi:hypothetical protein